MGYSGYSQFLDSKGHYWTEDCNIADLKTSRCPICSSKAVFENMVDETNGSFDEKGNRIDGFIELKVKKKISGVCSCCGKEHICEITYNIPKRRK